MQTLQSEPGEPATQAAEAAAEPGLADGKPLRKLLGHLDPLAESEDSAWHHISPVLARFA